MVKDDKEKTIRQLSAFVTLPFVLVVPVTLGWLMGHWLDRFLKVDLFSAYLGMGIGLLAGSREFYRIVKRYGDGS